MTTTIAIGARYRRPGRLWPVYRVLRIADFKHRLPHVTLVSENADQRTMTIAVGVLQDMNQWELAG
jgi:hypothetical protein